uniref:Uncharacterized protein n=1 Tax=Timema cristinae TaxID=61476 RepID=A0A7R9CDF6_TIMCR|nr:unnamed protein product [Timema cristinae]
MHSFFAYPMKEQRNWGQGWGRARSSEQGVGVGGGPSGNPGRGGAEQWTTITMWSQPPTRHPSITTPTTTTRAFTIATRATNTSIYTIIQSEESGTPPATCRQFGAVGDIYHPMGQGP